MYTIFSDSLISKMSQYLLLDMYMQINLPDLKTCHNSRDSLKWEQELLRLQLPEAYANKINVWGCGSFSQKTTQVWEPITKVPDSANHPNCTGPLRITEETRLLKA